MQVGIRKVALHFTLYYMAESTLVVDLRIGFETKPDMMQMWRKPTGADTSHRCEHRWLIDLVAVEQCDSRHTVDSKVSDTFLRSSTRILRSESGGKRRKARNLA